MKLIGVNPAIVWFREEPHSFSPVKWNEVLITYALLPGKKLSQKGSETEVWLAR